MGRFIMKNSFNSYVKQLQQLDVADTLLTGEKVICLMSGSSHLQHATLSAAQQDFLDDPIFEDYLKIASNFPFNQKFEHHQTVFPHLLSASLSNIRYFYHCLVHPKMKRELIRHLSPLFTLKEVVLITQSSGLNMLTQVLSEVDIRCEKCTIFALGPVSYRLLDKNKLNCLVMKANRDIYSNYLDRNKSDYQIEGHHFDYLKNKKVREKIHETIRKN